MPETLAPPRTPSDRTRLYRRALVMLNRAGVPYLVGGAYAFQRYVGFQRPTKDFDLFVRVCDQDDVLGVLRRAGFRADVVYSHWLAKARLGATVIDVIHSSGNGVSPVDDTWFAHAVDDAVLGVPVRLVAAEEMIWSKALIMERERYDGADVAHLLRHCARHLDWPRLVRRFGVHWRVLLSHLVLFGFIYPGDRALVPVWVMRGLMDRLQAELDAPPDGPEVCQGTLLSRAQYLVDVDEWGYEDARAAPHGAMTERQIAEWTAAIDKSD